MILRPKNCISLTFRALPMFFFFFFSRKRSKKAGCQKAPFASIPTSVNLPSIYLKAIWLYGSPLIFASFQTPDVRFQTADSRDKKRRAAIQATRCEPLRLSRRLIWQPLSTSSFAHFQHLREACLCTVRRRSLHRRAFLLTFWAIAKSKKARFQSNLFEASTNPDCLQKIHSA